MARRGRGAQAAANRRRHGKHSKQVRAWWAGLRIWHWVEPVQDCRDPDAVATSGTAGVVASNVVPKGVSDATCELARELLLLDRTTAPPGEGIASDWTSTAGKKYSKTDIRPILPRLLQSLLSKYGSPMRQGGGVVKLVRV